MALSHAFHPVLYVKNTKKKKVNYLIIKGRLVMLSGTFKGDYLKYFISFDISQ